MNYLWLNQKKRHEKNGPSAAVIRYDQEKDEAPVVVAQGRGHLARKIIELAEEHGIPLHQDESLVQHLLELDLGETIPPQLYAVMAEVLIMIERMEKKY